LRLRVRLAWILSLYSLFGLRNQYNIIDLIKKYMNSLVAKTTASYNGFIEFISQQKYQEKYLGQAIEADALIFSTLEKSSQEYLRVLLPGRP
jgi:hypothetical protein